MNLNDRIQRIIDSMKVAQSEAKNIASELRQEDREGLLDLVERHVLGDVGDVMVMMDHLKRCLEKGIEEPFDFY